MPTENKVDITLCLTDGTKLTRIEDLADVTTFLEQHEEFVKVVRCKECIVQKICRFAQFLGNDGYCSQGERDDEVDNGD